MNTAKRILVGLLLIAIVASAATAQSGARGGSRVVQYTLRVLSNAPDSRVFVNAVAQTGTTPLDLELNSGDYEIVVRAPGYRDYSTKVTLNRDLTINARLTPMTYRLEVSANAPGASVYVNNANRGSAPVNLTLQSGEYRVEVRANGYENYLTTVNLNRNLTLSATLKPMIYTVGVTANVKGATVFVNGANRGTAPVNLGLEIGRYTIRVSADGYLDYSQTVTVNRDTSLNATLMPAMSTVMISVPEEILNPMIKDPTSLFQVYVDEEPISDAELRQMRFQVTPGRHTLWFVTGGIRLAGTYVLNPARTYVLGIGLDLELIDQSR